jgi:hypothetical protein
MTHSFDALNGPAERDLTITQKYECSKCQTGATLKPGENVDELPAGTCKGSMGALPKLPSGPYKLVEITDGKWAVKKDGTELGQFTSRSDAFNHVKGLHPDLSDNEVAQLVTAVLK